MSGFWFASYIILWVLVVLLVLAFVATLRELGVAGVLRRARGGKDPDGIPTLQEDGPPLQSSLPTSALPAYARTGKAMVIFLTPLCEGCQDVVPAINELAATGEDAQIVVVLRATSRQAAAFLKVFPLSVPVVPDEKGLVTAQFQLQSAPFGLLYEDRVLVRKGRVDNGLDDLLALLGNPHASDTGRSRMHPMEAAAVEVGS